MYPKGQKQGIMAFKFFLPYSQLNLAFLTSEERQAIHEIRLLEEESVGIFEYGKINDGYWDGAKLHQHVVYKALPIAEVFYYGYSFFYLFDNAISHSIYAKTALQVKNINKKYKGK